MIYPALTSADVVELTRLVQLVDSRTYLVPLRRLRRVIRHLHHLRVSAQRTQHEHVFAVAKQALVDAGFLEDLNIPPTAADRLILLPIPTEEAFRDLPSLRLATWRKMFHVAIDEAVDQRLRSDPAMAGQIDAFWARIGGTFAEEISSVLHHEHLLFAVNDRNEQYREFHAFLLELHYFAPEHLPIFFPGFASCGISIEELIAACDARHLFQSTRLADTPDPQSHVGHDVHHAAGEPSDVHLPASLTESGIRRAISFDPQQSAESGEAARLGNDVRAAIVKYRMGQVAEAEKYLEHLVQRLRAPLHLKAPAAKDWGEALKPVLALTPLGVWTVAAQLLYELQKACIDVERSVYTIDLRETLATRGAKPLKRQLTKTTEVNILRRLRATLRKVPGLTLPTAQRHRLTHLLEQAIPQVAKRVRKALRPEIEAVLSEVGLQPTTQVERIAQRKIVEELLDEIVNHGYLTLGHVRDALARNRLKLPDVDGISTWYTDPLLHANRLLSIRLDGVYRRGEIYMRWMQRFSSLAFGTPPGRFLTKYVALPFGGAYLLLEGLHHFVEAVHSVSDWITGHSEVLAAVGSVAGGAAMTVVKDPHLGPSIWTAWWMILLVGCFLLGLIHIPPFRRQVGRTTRKVLIDVPLAIYHSPWLRGIFDNMLTRLFFEHLLTPLVMGALFFVALRLFEYDVFSSSLVGGGVALLTATMFRTPWGRGLEERLNDSLTRFWMIISANFFRELLTWITQVFRSLADRIEKGIYAVDEWLRFREGEGRIAFAFKLGFGFVWSLLSYVFRFCWNLLVEPQINPIKHFPVVTVSHKLLLPLIPSLAKTFSTSIATMTTIVGAIPGIFGFLVWELKENWKLYRANQSPRLEPVVVGSHGERVRGLLRPGFHSGVVPKTYARLRRAIEEGNWTRAHKYEHELDHVAEAIHRLVERSWLAVLRDSSRWQGRPIDIQHIQLTTNSIRIYLSGAHDEAPLVFCIEQHAGWLIGSIEQLGWLPGLALAAAEAFRDSLLGFAKYAGIYLFREHVAAFWRVPRQAIDTRTNGLIIRVPNQTPLYWYWTGEGELIATDADDEPLPGCTPVRSAEVLFGEQPLSWQEWSERWEADCQRIVISGPLMPEVRGLPGSQ